MGEIDNIVNQNDNSSINDIVSRTVSVGDSKTSDTSVFKEAAITVAKKVTRPAVVVASTAIASVEQFQRAGFAIAGAVHAASTGEDISEAVWKGLTLQEKKTFSDSLDLFVPEVTEGAGRGLAAKKAARTIAVQGGGLALDIILDPITYSAGLGAFTKVGKEASKLGKATLADDLLKRIKIGDKSLDSIKTTLLGRANKIKKTPAGSS